jgi:hypothetical protein
MSEHFEQDLTRPDEAPRQEVATETPAEVANVAGPAGDSAPAVAEPSSRHAEAGRKGARRIHDLIRLGRLYEQEHGLTRGRQRLRQLIEEGKLYEQEHGLGPRRVKRRSRLRRNR